MTTANDILGTTGKEAIPFEYQVEEQKISRDRALAQLMLTNGMKKAPEQMFGQHRVRRGMGEQLTKALSTFMGARGMAAADERSTGNAQKMQTAQSTDMSEVLKAAQGTPGTMTESLGSVEEPMPPTMTGGVKGDISAAYARAMQSPFKNVQAVGTDLQKNNRELIAEQLKALAPHSPAMAVRRSQEQNPMSVVPDITTPPIEFREDPKGNMGAVTKDNKGGKPTFTYAPQKTDIRVGNDMKLTNNANDDAAKFFNYGGKGYEAATLSVSNITKNGEILRTLSQSPSGGAGAEVFQTARKWAETLGVPTNDKTTPTEMASMQLGDRVLTKLGGLGAQVSDADRKFMIDTQGSIANDPEALRRILLIENKYHMQLIDKHNKERTSVLEGLPSGMRLPEINFSYMPANKQDDDDFLSLMQNKSFMGRAKPALVLPSGLKKVP